MFKNIVVALTANTTGLRAGMAQAQGSVAALDTQMKTTTATGAGLRKVLAGLAIGGLVAMAVGLGSAVKASANFESSMNRVGALTSATASEFDALSDEALRLGSTTAFSASQAADGMSFFAMAGFEVNEILSAMPSTLDLATVGQLELADAADIASNVLQGFGLEATETARVNDVLALTAVSANTSVQQLGDAMSYVAPVANAAGYAIEDVSAAVGVLSDAGIQGGRAGTTLVGVLATLEDRTGPASEALKRMGINTHDATGALLPLADVVEQFEERGLSAGEALEIFGRRAGPGMAVLVSTGADALRDLETRLDGAAGAAERIAQRQFQGLEAAMITLKSATEGALIAVGGFMLPGLTAAVETVASGVQSFAQIVSGATEEAGRFAPIIENVTSISGSLADIIGRVVSAAVPLVATLASLAATGAGAALLIITDALAGILSFVSNNEAAFAALAAVLGALLLPALARVVTQMQVMAVMGLVRVIDGISAAATRAGVALGKMTAAGGLLTALAAAIVYVGMSAKSARDEAEALAGRLRDAFGQGIDTTTTSGQIEALGAQIEGLGGRAERLKDEMSERNFGQSMMDSFRWTDNANTQLHATQEELDELEAKLREMESTATSAMERINAELEVDLDLEQIFAMADALGIDLANGAGDAVDALVAAAAAARAGEPDYADLANEVDELASAQQRAADAVRDHASAMREATDPIFAAQQASQRYADALNDLRQLEKDGDASARDLANARREVGSASVDLAGALGELRDETGELIATEPQLRAYFESMNVPDDVIDQLIADFDLVRGELDEFEGRNPELTLGVDTTEVTEGMTFAESIGSEFSANNFQATLSADPAPAEGQVGSLVGLVRDSWHSQTFESTAEADTTPALGAFAGVIQVGEGWRGRTDTSTVDADSAPAGASFAGAVQSGLAWDRSSYTSTVRADASQANTAIGGLARTLGSLVSRAWNIRVNASTRHSPSITEADGGVVSYYADGGFENHVAQIAPAGAWRVWAEPETGGEAYIPLAPAKRERSEAILGDVARRFGYQVVPYAGGGVNAPASAAGGRDRGKSINIEQKFYGEAARSTMAEARHQARIAALEVGT